MSGPGRGRLAIVGAAALTPLGDEPAALLETLTAGKSGIQPVTLFPTDSLPCHLGGEIQAFDPAAYLGNRNLRPVDRTARLLLAAAGRALESSGYGAGAERAVGLALGTTFCSVRTIAEFDRRGLTLGPGLVSPMDFANCVINAAAGQTAIWFRLAGLNSTVSAGEASGLAAALYAADLIAAGRCPAMLAGGVEELCLESYLSHVHAGRLAGSGADAGPEMARPFDRRSLGFTLAEGAGLVVLEQEESAAGRGASPLGWWLGGATAFAAVRQEKSRAETLARVIGQAMSRAGVEPGEISVWFASANGSPELDRAEAAGLALALGESARTLPTTAIKSMLGESLGASGGLLLVVMLETLRQGRVPPIPGLEEPREELRGLWSAGQVLPLRLGTDTARRIGLATAISSDGHCVAVLAEGAR